MIGRLLNNVWFKRIFGSFEVALAGMMLIGGAISFISDIWFGINVSLSIFITTFLLLLALFLGCTCLYACNPKLWGTVHNKRDDALFKLLPDINLIVELAEYVGDVLPNSRRHTIEGENMIDLDNIVMVIFDFDDTLCIHNNRVFDEELYNVSMLRDGYKSLEGTPSVHMKKFIEECEKRDIRMGLMSATMSYKHMEEKQLWVKENYGVSLENFSVGSSGDKTSMLLAISDAYSIERQQILLVDDYYKTVIVAEAAGFSTCSPIEIANYVEGDK